MREYNSAAKSPAAKSPAAKGLPDHTLPPETPLTPPGAVATMVDPDGAVAGYIRTSVLAFPPDCRGPAARVAFVQQLSGLRRLELVQAAAARGQAIGAWYEDLDRSGRAEFRTGRDGFEALTLAARAGRLKGVFAWDLSRLFRDLVGQELWLEEMEARGVAVHVQDLPFAVDAPTRRLLRQELGMISEYQAARVGALFSAALNQRVEQGRWVGRTYSQWGLRYDASLKGFVRDDATAPLICRVYEAFNALGGSASMTARALNREVEEGRAGALRPPRSGRWDVTKVLLHVRDPLYRRRAAYNGAEYDAPHLIPEVVPAAVLAATDALLAARRGIYEECAARYDAPPAPYLYARVLRCAECGGGMQATPRQGVLGPTPGLRVPWVCSDALRGGACGARFRLPQPRLTALLDRGLRRAFAAARSAAAARPVPPEEAEAAREGRRRHKKRLQGRVRACDRARDRSLESYSAGLLTDRALLQQRLAALSARRLVAQEALEQAQAARAAGPQEERWLESDLGRLGERFGAVWPHDWWQPYDADKAQFLRGLGLTVSVRLLPMRKKPAPETGATGGAPRKRGAGPFVPHLTCGLCELDLVCPALGIGDAEPLRVAETEQELEDYNRLRLIRSAPPADS